MMYIADGPKSARPGVAAGPARARVQQRFAGTILLVRVAEPAMEQLPNELLHSIIATAADGVPNRPAFLTLRLVCKAFHALATPLAFHTLTVRSSECSLDRLEHIVGTPHLVPLVREYAYRFDEPPRRYSREQPSHNNRIDG